MNQRIVVVAAVLVFIFAGLVAAAILKTYQMNAVSQKTNLRLYYNADLNETHVIQLNNFNWTAATNVTVTNGTVLNMWARNEGNQAANFTFTILNPINCTIVIAPQALPINFQPGAVASVNLTLSNVLDDPSWQIAVNY